MAHPVPVLFASTRFYRSNHMYLLLWIGIVHEASAHCAYYSNEVGQLVWYPLWTKSANL